MITDTHETWGGGKSNIDDWNNSVGREFGSNLLRKIPRKFRNEERAREKIKEGCALRLDRDLVRMKFRGMRTSLPSRMRQ